MITLLLAVSAFFAGIVNAIAGGGSFLTFPALIFAGVPPIAANATSTAALLPGALAGVWGYRKNFERIQGLSVALITIVSVFGGAAGAFLLLNTPERTFTALIPWLLLAATAIFALGRRAASWAHRHFRIVPASVIVIQFAIAVYGGYFGGGIGILMLAIFGIFGMTNLIAMNALKIWLNACLNGMAVLLFVARDQVLWQHAAIMAVAATAGGYAGATAARKTDPAILRGVIVAIGLGLSAYFFFKN